MKTNASLLISLLLTLTACGTPDADEELVDDPDALAQEVAASSVVCASQHSGATADGDAVVVCDALYPEAPRVHLPRDRRGSTSTSTSTLYAALSFGEGGAVATVVDRKGAEYTVVTATGEAVTPQNAARELPSELRMPSNRHFYLLYRLRGVIGTYTNPFNQQQSRALRILNAKPYALLPGALLDAQLLGTWEGTVSRRVDASKWSLTEQVPFRVTFSSTVAIDPFWTWEDRASPRLPDGTRFEVRGRFDNLTAAVTGESGQCLPALTSYGAANPFYGATQNELALWRLTSMHVLGDYQLAIRYPAGTPLGVGMGAVAPVHPQALISSAPPSSWGAGSHNAWTFLFDMRRVTAGGAGCTP